MAALYQRLSATVNEMPPDSVEAHVAAVMLDQIQNLDSLTIGEVASLCAVSKSSISKFVRFLGFEDYMDFRAEAIRQKEKEVYFQNAKTINITDYMLENGRKSYLKVLFTDIQRLLTGLDSEKLERLATMIHDFRRIASFGDVYSETAALNLQFKMSYYQKYIYTTTNDRRQAEYIRNADSDTLILVFSNSGRYISMYPTLEGSPAKTCFDQTKATVVLFTSNAGMQNDPRVDLCFSWTYADRVQNHPVLYQLVIEQIALTYQKKYGFPMDGD